MEEDLTCYLKGNTNCGFNGFSLHLYNFKQNKMWPYSYGRNFKLFFALYYHEIMRPPKTNIQATRVTLDLFIVTWLAGHTMEWNVNPPYSIAGKIFHTIPFHNRNLPFHTKNLPFHLPYFSIPSVKLTPCTNTSENKWNGANPGLGGTLYKNNLRRNA